jgi:hypothetical protein
MKNGVHVSWNQQAIDHEDVALGYPGQPITDRQVFVSRSRSAICILVPFKKQLAHPGVELRPGRASALPATR